MGERKNACFVFGLRLEAIEVFRDVTVIEDG